MRAFLYTLGKQAVMTAVMMLLVFSPFQALLAQAQSAAPAPGTTATAACDITSPSTYDLCITNVVYVFTVGIGTGFAYIAAYFFDIAVQLSLNGTAYALTFISTGWTT